MMMATINDKEYEVHRDQNGLFIIDEETGWVFYMALGGRL